MHKHYDSLIFNCGTKILAELVKSHVHKNHIYLSIYFQMFQLGESKRNLFACGRSLVRFGELIHVAVNSKTVAFWQSMKALTAH